MKLRVEGAFAFLVLMILLLGFWWFPGSSGNEDTFSSGIAGKKAFFDLVAELQTQVVVERNIETVLPPPDADVLCILGPARYPDDRKLAQLLDWVESGNSLIIAARNGDPSFDLAPIPVKVVRPESSDPDEEEVGDEEEEEETEEEPEAEEEDIHERPDFLNLFGQEIDTDLAEGEFTWRSNGFVEDVNGTGTVLVWEEDTPHVVLWKMGSGILIVCSSDFIFTNDSMVRDDNCLLAYRILEQSAIEGSIYFDESLNANGPAKVVGLLFDPPFRPLTLQILLIGVLFCWWGCRRFGPPISDHSSLRRNIVEHATALGHLYYKAGAGARAVRSYFNYFRRGLHQGSRGRGDAMLAKTLARRTDAKEEDIMTLLTQVKKLEANKRIPSARAASLLKKLATLQAGRHTKRKGVDHGT